MTPGLVALALLAALVGGLVAQALWDSAVGSWVALVSVLAYVVGRLLGVLPGLLGGDGDD